MTQLRKIARQTSIVALFVSALSMVVLPHIMSPDTTPLQRRYEIREYEIPNGIIEIVAVKNLQSDYFPTDFEIDIRNVSNKPIYFIEFLAILPEAKQFLGIPLGFQLSHGSHRLVNNKELAQPTDPMILPGATITLKSLSPREHEGLQSLISKGKLPESATSKVLLMPQVLNFGDGTGFIGSAPFNSERASAIRKNQTFKPRIPSAQMIKFTDGLSVTCDGWHKEEFQPCHDADPEFCKPERPLEGGPYNMTYCILYWPCWSPQSQDQIYCNKVAIYNCNDPSPCF